MATNLALLHGIIVFGSRLKREFTKWYNQPWDKSLVYYGLLVFWHNILG